MTYLTEEQQKEILDSWEGLPEDKIKALSCVLGVIEDIKRISAPIAFGIFFAEEADLLKDRPVTFYSNCSGEILQDFITQLYNRKNKIRD